MRISRTLFVALGLAAAAFAFASPSEESARPEAGAGAKGAALGVFLGQPTGVTFRYGLGGEQSLEAKAAWDFGGTGREDASLILQANWLMEFPGILKIEGESFPLYAGAGVQIGLGDETSLGVRVPGGVLYRFKRAPIELCLELGLGLDIIPATTISASGGLGARYRF